MAYCCKCDEQTFAIPKIDIVCSLLLCACYIVKKSHFHPTPLPTKGKEIDACSLIDGEGFIFLIVLVINFGLG
jgi:hypothetical protein